MGFKWIWWDIYIDNYIGCDGLSKRFKERNSSLNVHTHLQILSWNQEFWVFSSHHRTGWLLQHVFPSVSQPISCMSHLIILMSHPKVHAIQLQIKIKFNDWFIQLTASSCWMFLDDFYSISILYASVLLLFWFCCVFFHFFLNPTSSCYVFPCFPATFRRKSPSKVPLRQRRLPAASPGPVPSALRHVGTARPWDPRHAAPCRSFGKPMRILKSHEKYMKSTWNHQKTMVLICFDDGLIIEIWLMIGDDWFGLWTSLNWTPEALFGHVRTGQNWVFRGQPAKLRCLVVMWGMGSHFMALNNLWKTWKTWDMGRWW